jgi:tetratricopeptide (TPR) repeat protein
MRTLALYVLSVAMASAQHLHPSAPPSEKPVALLAGLGIWSHPIATSNPEAQKFFDQGLALLYGFNRYEALRSFRKAADLDPKAAMPYWGMAMALGPYINMDMDPGVNVGEACKAVEAGLKIEGANEAERGWLQAVATRCPEYDPARYVAAMRELARRYPDDPDLQTFYADSLMVPSRWRWYGPDGKPGEGIEEAERVLEAVLRRFPEHPGANHFYIHAVESSPTPERAVPSAQRLMGIVPSAGHLVHMPGHIWLVLGDYENAVAVNERAAQVDREYFAKTGVESPYYFYYLHNLQFIAFARAMQGRVSEANKAIAELMDASKPMAASMPEMADVFGAFAAMVRLRVNRWDDLIATPAPKSGTPLALSMWRYSRAVAFAVKGKIQEASGERIEFDKARAKVDRSAPWGSNKTGAVMDLAAAVLDARLSLSSRDAIGKWRRAVEIQDALAYDEPPAWYYPVRESLGAALLRAGDAPGAEAAFREGVRRSPHNGWMLFGLMESLKAQGKSTDAAWVEREYKAAWKGADLELRLNEM